MLQQTAKLEGLSSKEANPLQAPQVCKSKPHVTRRAPNRVRGCCVLVLLLCYLYYCCVSANFKYTRPAVTPPSNVLPTPTKPRHTHTKHHKIGKDETRYTNLGHTENRSACQLCFLVSGLKRVSLALACFPGGHLLLIVGRNYFEKTRKATSAVRSTDRSILNFGSCVTTVRAFSIISPAIDYWPVTPLDATRGGETTFTRLISNGSRAVYTIPCTETAVRT